jgi:hypothetical protein
MVVIPNGDIIYFGQKDERARVVVLLEGKFTFLLIQVPYFGPLRAAASDDSSVVGADVVYPFLVTQ